MGKTEFQANEHTPASPVVTYTCDRAACGTTYAVVHPEKPPEWTEVIRYSGAWINRDYSWHYCSAECVIAVLAETLLEKAT